MCTRERTLTIVMFTGALQFSVGARSPKVFAAHADSVRGGSPRQENMPTFTLALNVLMQIPRIPETRVKTQWCYWPLVSPSPLPPLHSFYARFYLDDMKKVSTLAYFSRFRILSTRYVAARGNFPSVYSLRHLL